MADGTGGHERGEIASKLVLDAVIAKCMPEGSFGTRALHSYIDYAIVNVAQRKKRPKNG
jgi:serine/threonine protein phosphatase PrpC